MRHLNKLWVKILLSLLCGVMIGEFYHLRTGNPNSPPILFWGGAVLVFIILHIVVYFYNWRKSKEK